MTARLVEVTKRVTTRHLSRTAFISYAREDRRLGVALESVLSRFGRPWWRPRRIFRDETALGAGALWPSLEKALSESEWLVVIASQAAADPKGGVAREVDYWLSHGGGQDRILLACADGKVIWKDDNEIDRVQTSALPPSLKSIPLTEKNVIDFTWARTSSDTVRDRRFRSGAVKLLAEIEGKPADEIDGEHVRQQRRWKLLRICAAVILSALLVVITALSVNWYGERNKARSQLVQATALRLVSEAQLMLNNVRHEGDLRAFQQLLAANAIASINPGALLDAVIERRSTLKIMPANSRVRSVAVNPVTRLIVSGGQDGVIQLWDPSTGREVGTAMTAGPVPIPAVAFSPDGRIVLTGDADGAVRLWDVATRTQIGETPVRHRVAVTSVSFNPKGSRFVSADEDGTMQVWDTATRQLAIPPIRTRHYQVWSVAFSPDGRQIASGSEDGTVELWDAATGAAAGPPMAAKKQIWSVAFSPDGQRLVSAGWGDTELWDLTTHLSTPIPPTHRGGVWSVAFSPDGRQLVSGGVDNTVQVWNSETWQPAGSPLTGHQGDVKSVTFGADAGTVISGSLDETVRVWRLGTDEPAVANTTAPVDAVEPMAFIDDASASSRRIVSGARGAIRAWDAITGQPVGDVPPLNAGSISSLALSSDGRRIASGMKDGSIQLWDATSGRPLRPPISAASDAITSLAMSATGERVVAVGQDGSMSVWASDSGQPVGRRIQLPRDEISSLGLSADGNHIVCGTHEGEVQVWETSTGTPITAAVIGDIGDDSRFTDVVAVAFSPDGTRVVSAGAGDDTIRQWALGSRELVPQAMTGHENNLNAVTFSASGKYIVSGANDDTVRLWLAATGEPVGQPLQAFQAGVSSVAMSADERVVASGGHDGSIRVWPGPASWAQNLCAKFTARISEPEWQQWVSSEIGYQTICPLE